MPQKSLRGLLSVLLTVLVLNLAVSTAAAQQIRHGVYRGMPVTYTLSHGKAIFQGDVILEKVDPIDPRRPMPLTLGVTYSQYLWPKVGNQFQIPYIIDPASGDQTNLNAAITQFNNTFANIRFVPRTTQTDYVDFNFNPNDFSGVCDATVGRAGGEQQVGGSGSCALGTILHEMGHTVGLWHEQSRSDRNTFVSVNYSNLIKGSISNFNQIYDNAQELTLFDYASIMEYPAFSFSRNGGPAIESIPAGIPLSNLTGYTAADIEGIERLCGSAPTSVTVTTNPPGLQVIVDNVTVTTPQVFSWPLFSSHTLDIPSGVQSQAGFIVNSNQPTTFYYTYGRWNDSASSSHSITVLPGNGEAASPASSPAVTTYTANFIELVPYAATVSPAGTGSVTPSPAPQSYTGSSLLFYTARQQVTLTAAANSGQNFYEFNNAPFWLPGGLGANPKTFYVPDTGLTVNTTVEFSPNPVYTVDVTPDAFSSNLYIYADGGFWYAPKNFSSFYDSAWTAGSAHTLNLDSLVYPYSSNSRYRFSSWDDGTTTTTDNITLPSTSTPYVASLTPEFFVTDYVNQSCAASISVTPGSPTGDGFYPIGQGLTFTEVPNTGWLFTGWQYDLSGTSTSEPLTVTDEVLATADYSTTTTPLSLTSLNPAAAVPGGSAFTLTLNGTGFTSTSVVSVAGAFPVVEFISPMQLSVAVTAAQIAKTGAFQVWVENFPTGASCAAFGALPFMVANKPTVSPTPSSLAFNPQTLNTTSAAKTITFKNTGTSSVTINSIAATGDFAIASNTCGSSLGAGASCTVNVTFAPVVSGALAGSLAISDSAPDSPQTVSLSGTGNLPLSLSPAALPFGSVAVGHTSTAKTSTLTNNEASTVNLTFSASGNYAINSSGTTCAATLASKATCKIAATFTPTTNGAVNGAVTIGNGTSDSPQLVALTGTGTGGSTPPLTFTPATITFASQTAGTTSAAKSITVKNASTSSLTISTITSSGDFAASGSGGAPCKVNLVLTAGHTCTMGVTFTPALGSSGSISGAIVLTDTAAINTQVLDVKGTAVLPLTLSPATLTFGAQTVGTASAAQIITITNNLSTSISPTFAGNGDFAVVAGGTTPCGSTLLAHAQCTFAVTFTPSAVGTRGGAITVLDSSNPGVQIISVIGTGQ